MNQKKEAMLESLKALLRVLQEAQIKTEAFYNSMRWENLNLSEGEYEKLFDEGKIHEIEEVELFYRLESLINVLEDILK